MNRNLHLHVITTASLISQLREANRRARATQNYLLCKAAVERRRSEDERRREQGKDTFGLERMIARLEKAIKAHRRLMMGSTDDG